MHIRVMTDPQAYLKTTGGGSGGAANTELARQLITGKLSAESQIAKAANGSAPDAGAGGAVKLSRWAPMLLLTGPCADIYDEARSFRASVVSISSFDATSVSRSSRSAPSVAIVRTVAAGQP